VNSINQTEFEPDSYEWSFIPQPDLSTLDTSCFPNVLNICFPDTGLYTIQLIATNAFGTDTAKHQIRVYDSIPDFTLGQNVSICQGDSVILRRPAFPFGTTWVWTTPMGNYLNTDSVIAKVTGVYRLTATNFCGIKSASIDLTVNSASITISAGQDVDTCIGSLVTLQANATGTNLNYRWNTGATSLSIVVNTPGLYWVEASNECAVKRDSVEVRMRGPSFGNINLGTDTTLCRGQTILLQGPTPPQAGWTYLWQNGSNAPSLLASAEGDYWLEMFDGECRRRDSVKIFYKNPPSIQLPADFTLCEYDSLQIDISSQLLSGDIVRWNDGADSIVRILKQPGTYWCEVSNRCGVDRDSVIIGQIKTPVYSIGDNMVLCNTASYTIQVNPVLDSVRYLWNSGDTTTSITVNNSGLYSVTVSNRCASVTKSVDITFRKTPVIDLPTNDSLLCRGEIAQLTAIATGNDNTTTYNWSNGATGLTVAVSQAGNYVISASNSCGTAKDSATISYSLLPADIFNADTFLCDNQTIQLISLVNDPSYDYLWSTGAVSSSITINKAGEYHLLIKDGRCSASDTIRAYQCEAGRCLFIPNAFSPNGNGVNETFKPIVMYCHITGYEMFVFDRLGRRVFYSNKLSEGWDGRITNGTLQPGVYVYKLNYYVQTTNNRRIPFVKYGTVTVVL
jgi:gliding motility-associated-like protein